MCVDRAQRRHTAAAGRLPTLEMRDGAMTAVRDTFARFEDLYIPEPNSGCWLWIGSTASRRNGMQYGKFRFAGKTMGAHRASYLLFCGPIPKGALVCHRCDMPPCVNPEHLFLGTQAGNIADMIRKGRSAHARYPELMRARGLKRFSGTNNPKAKLTPEIAEIIRVDARTTQQLADEYDVSYQTIWHIRKEKTWAQ